MIPAGIKAKRLLSVNHTTTTIHHHHHHHHHHHLYRLLSNSCLCNLINVYVYNLLLSDFVLTLYYKLLTKTKKLVLETTCFQKGFKFFLKHFICKEQKWSIKNLIPIQNYRKPSLPKMKATRLNNYLEFP